MKSIPILPPAPVLKLPRHIPGEYISVSLNALPEYLRVNGLEITGAHALLDQKPILFVKPESES